MNRHSETSTPAEYRERVETQQESVVTSLESHPAVTVTDTLWLANAIVIEADTDRLDLEEEIASLDRVELVHSNFELQRASGATATGTASGLTTASTDPATYGVEMIAAPQVWDEFDTKGDGARVAVVDTGVDADHPDIDLYTEDPSDPTYPGGWAEFDSEGQQIEGSTPYDSDDDIGHGTHVSGTIAGGNASGTHVGVAPAVELMHAKGLDGGVGSFAQVVAAMEWAVENDADIMGISIGGDASEGSIYIDEFIEPIRNANDLGVLVVGASGNTGVGRSTSPGNVYDVLTVGAVDETGDVPSFSNGEEIDTGEAWENPPDEWPETYVVPDVTAPGVGVESTLPGGNYGQLSGTSMATPHTAGAAALLQSVDGQLTVEETKQVLATTADHPAGEGNEDNRYGTGIVNVSAAAETVTTTDLSGTITDASDGTPIGNAIVSVGEREALSDSTGQFTLQSPTRGQTVEVSAFGYETVSETVDVPVLGTVELDTELEPTLETRVADDQPARSVAGNEINVTFEVANLDSLTVDFTEESEISRENTTVTVENTTAGPGEDVVFNESKTGVISVSVELAETARGSIELAHTVTGSNRSVTLKTGPTTVVDPPPFEVVATNFPGTVERFEEYSVTALIENDGDVSDTQRVSYAVGAADSIRAERSLRLEPGEAKSVEIRAAVDDRPEDYTQWISTSADATSRKLTVEGPEFVVTDFTSPTSVERGKNLSVSATVTNVGNRTGTMNVSYQFDETELEDTAIELSAGETRTVSFDVPTDGFPLGSHEHSVRTIDNATGAVVEIEGNLSTSDYAIDGEYTSQSVFDAIDDWREDTVSAQLVFDVIEAWRTG